jgi:hypothetical protein
MNDESVGRDWNEGEEDHEGYMAVAQLHRIVEMSNMMLDVIGENDEIPGWIQYKITRAYNDLNDAFAYIEYESHEESPEVPGEVLEGRKKKKGLWANIHARRKAGKRPKRPGEKGYPKTLDIGESIVREFIKEIMKEK